MVDLFAEDCTVESRPAASTWAKRAPTGFSAGLLEAERSDFRRDAYLITSSFRESWMSIQAEEPPKAAGEYSRRLPRSGAQPFGRKGSTKTCM